MNRMTVLSHWTAWGLLCCLGCRTTPITGRHQVMLLPETQEISMGLTSYEELMAEESLSHNQQLVAMVDRVGHRIAKVAQRPDYEWEFRLIASPTMNAFALPGGKVAVYEGILPICQNEAGLAVVMSHEVAHALARHGGERVSHTMMVNSVGTLLNYATQRRDQIMRDRLMKAYGVASQYGVILPYSRKHESEADHMGLLLMAQAGYDPTEAPAFWERFAAAQEGERPLEFLSTHPADDRRAEELRALLPEAIRIYGQTAKRHGIGETIVVERVAADGTPVQLTSHHAAPSLTTCCGGH